MFDLEELAADSEARTGHQYAQQLVVLDGFLANFGREDANNERIDEIQNLDGLGVVVGVYMLLEDVDVLHVG